MKVIGDLWGSRENIFRINIEPQMFKYLKRFSFLVIDKFLDQNFEEETNFEKQLKIGWIITWKKTIESYGILNWYINIHKLVKGKVGAEDYKRNHEFFEKGLTDIYIQ